MKAPLYEIPVKKIDGRDTTLAEYQGKVLLVVNVASKCGLTPQYEGLEKLYEEYRARGLEVLGFPANEFLGQEPGTNAEIQEFCRMSFGVKFPLFSKVVVKGEGQHPLYKHLIEVSPKRQAKGGGFLGKVLAVKGLLTGTRDEIQWNFEKFLVNRKGEVVARFAPDVEPQDPTVTKAVEAELERV
ncbi:MAG: redoxin domain-containing protein [Bdellovibrionales bacterium]|nr:redoxin domain-containing protein [Bdellovibrionales bacterium]